MRLKWKLFRIEERIAALENRINNPTVKEDIVCEVCGCLLPCYAFKEKGEIRQKAEYNSLHQCFITVDYIHYPYYCKIHIPKTSDPNPDTPQDGQPDQPDRK